MCFIILTIIASLTLSVIMLVFEKRGNVVGRFVAKTFASLFFVMSAFVASIFASKFDILFLAIVQALLLSMLGDIFLCIEHIASDTNIKIMRLIGTSFFLTAHLAYFIVFALFAGTFNYWLLMIVLFLPAIIFALEKLKVLKLGALTVPAALYAAIIGAMLSGAINLFSAAQSIGSAIIFAAALLFVISDTSLLLYNFGPRKHFALRISCIIPYYTAQCLFALSILFL